MITKFIITCASDGNNCISNVKGGRCKCDKEERGARINKDYTGKAKVTAIMTGMEPTWIFCGRHGGREGKR